jgi:hypothetical protein
MFNQEPSISTYNHTSSFDMTLDFYYELRQTGSSFVSTSFPSHTKWNNISSYPFWSIYSHVMEWALYLWWISMYPTQINKNLKY